MFVLLLLLWEPLPGRMQALGNPKMVFFALELQWDPRQETATSLQTAHSCSALPDICMTACLSVCLLVCLSVRIYVCLFVCLFVCLSTCLSICLYVYLLVCLSAFCLCVCLLYVCMSVSLSVCLLVCLHACLTVYLSAWQPIGFLLIWHSLPFLEIHSPF